MGRSSETPEGPGNDSIRRLEEDSEGETEAELPDWKKTLSQDTLVKLNKTEQKRQEVLNGEHKYIFIVH